MEIVLGLSSDCLMVVYMPDRDWFIANGCELVRPDVRLFFAVFAMSNGDPCRQCNCKATCPAWRILSTGAARPARHGSGNPLCPQCRSPLNMAKVAKRGGKCACGATISEPAR